jgi:hypothetical protein
VTASYSQLRSWGQSTAYRRHKPSCWAALRSAAAMGMPWLGVHLCTLSVLDQGCSACKRLRSWLLQRCVAAVGACALCEGRAKLKCFVLLVGVTASCWGQSTVCAESAAYPAAGRVASNRVAYNIAASSGDAVVWRGRTHATCICCEVLGPLACIILR